MTFIENEIVEDNEIVVKFLVETKCRKPSFHITYGDQQLDYTIYQLEDEKFALYVTLPCKNKVLKICEADSQNKIIYQKKYGTIKLKLNGISKKAKGVVRKIGFIFQTISKAIRFFWKQYHFLVPVKMLSKYINDFRDKVKRQKDISFYNPMKQEDYIEWINKEEKPSDMIGKHSIRVIISCREDKDLAACIASIRAQRYKNYKITVIGYHGEKGIFKDCQFSELNHIKYSEYLEDYLVFLDASCILRIDALSMISMENDFDVMYADSDRLDVFNQRKCPFFKPGYAKDTLLGFNYMEDFITVDRKFLIQMNMDGIDYMSHDVLLKMCEKTDNIRHIPEVLVHRRSEYDVGDLSSVEEALRRRKQDAIIRTVASDRFYVEYKIVGNPKISLIIPTRDMADILETCLHSIYEKTTYDNFEVIIADNGSRKEETFKLFESYKTTYDNFDVVRIETEFNYSHINNVAIKKATGEYIVLLNNDTEVISPSWLEGMLSYAQLPHIGCVGPKLLYPDHTIQHAGVILGVGGIAIHEGLNMESNYVGKYRDLIVPRNCSALTAACLMVKKDIFNTLGGLDEEFKVAYNDIDFNLRVLQAGYSNIYVPNVELIHYESKSRGLDTTSEKFKLHQEESSRMKSRWGNQLRNDPFYNKNFSREKEYMLDKN